MIGCKGNEWSVAISFLGSFAKEAFQLLQCDFASALLILLIVFSRKILEGPVTERKKTPVQSVVKSRGKINPIISLPSWEVSNPLLLDEIRIFDTNVFMIAALTFILFCRRCLVPIVKCFCNIKGFVIGIDSLSDHRLWENISVVVDVSNKYVVLFRDRDFVFFILFFCFSFRVTIPLFAT